MITGKFTYAYNIRYIIYSLYKVSKRLIVLLKATSVYRIRFATQITVTLTGCFETKPNNVKKQIYHGIQIYVNCLF